MNYIFYNLFERQYFKPITNGGDMTWNLRIIYSGDKIEVYKVNNYKIKTGLNKEVVKVDLNLQGIKLRRKKRLISRIEGNLT